MLKRSWGQTPKLINLGGDPHLSEPHEHFWKQLPGVYKWLEGAFLENASSCYALQDSPIKCAK